MANTNDDSDIELELEQMRRELAKPEPITSNQNPASIASNQNHTLVTNTQNAEPIASNQNIELYPQKLYTSSYIAIGLLIVGVGAGFFTLYKAQQWTLAKSQTVIAKVETVKNSPDINSLTNAEQSLTETIAILEKMPNAPGFPYKQAQADLVKLRGLQSIVGVNFLAAENLKNAEKLAMEAAILVQKPPHPVKVWYEAKQKWQMALLLVKTIPVSTSVAEIAQQKLPAYRSNYEIISKRFATAQQAADFNNRGVLKLEKAEYRRALEYFTQAVSLNSSIAESYFGRGIAYSALGNNQKAVQEYNQVIKLNANYSQAYFNRALAQYVLGNKQQTVSDLSETIRVEPNHARAYLERGSLRYELGIQEKGIEDLQKASELFSQQGDTKNLQQAEKLISQWQGTAEPAAVAVSDAELEDSELDECEDAWQSHSPALSCYLPSVDITNRRDRQPLNTGSTNILPKTQSDAGNTETSIRTPSRSRGGSFSRSRRR
ncbi:tetratricopeptide repeat protein [Microcoleus sp. FACHB-672]|uniref:tetratricopeptide repeat protein n=1 Tax=Microcoleus sp. FACHB-672 TaxID=2692825 RepID=UPI00168389F8|nr:tetratricopeptide repeat protein [Microcoleus sp. FACHB-672]MBD2042502.1 tetratricopeptide repeat protein [Microcoleus sp. FACHB-672]